MDIVNISKQEQLIGKEKSVVKMKPRILFVLAIVLALILVPLRYLGGEKSIDTYGRIQPWSKGFPQS
jgi:hypothetical protein